MKKNVDNSVDYKPFFTRDYKSVSTNKHLGQSRLTRVHIVLIVASVMVVSTLLTFFSLDASANRTSALTALPAPTTQIPLPVETTTNAIEKTKPAQSLQEQREWVSTTVKAGDSLARIFDRMDLPAEELHKIMQLGEPTNHLRRLLPGQNIKFLLNEQNVIHTLILELNRFDTFALQRDSDSYIASTHHRDVEKRIGHAVAKIDSSLFEAGQRAGMGDPLIMEMANIFGWDIDFALDIRTGDQFALIYEQHYLDGEKIEEGPILAAEFTTQGQTYSAIRFTDTDGNSEYYTPEGMSMRKAFLRTPVDFRRISSRFGNRHHPILNSMKMHKGVDYSAAVGTPIRASGEGKVIYKGTKGGYGRTVIIQHGGSYSTLYAHMSDYKKGADIGKRVRQGQVIGYVGKSGLATGPHLHYEFRVNGAYRNPLTIKLPNAEPLPAKYQPAFASLTQTLLAQLATVKQSTRIALNQP